MEKKSTAKGSFDLADGVYKGTGTGYAGDITVSVQIKDKQIVAIDILSSSDDAAFFNRAMDVVKNVMKKQSTDVDTVSGATYSSKGLLNAIKNALKQAEKATNGESLDEKVDTAKLTEAIENVNKLEESEYTEATWAVLKVRLQEAKEAMEAKEQAAVNKALDNLNQAVTLLEKKDSGDNEDKDDRVYIDGTYTVTVPCEPDEDEDFETYNLTMNVTIRDDKIVAITDIYGDGSSTNDSYIKKATNGTSSKEGVISQIVNKGLPEEIDAVSRATCSSNAIVAGCEKALEEAKRPEKTEAE